MALQCLDLMIDDIVRIAKDVCIPKGTVVSIKGIDANNRFIEKHLVGSVSCLPINDEYGTTCGVWVEYLEPIPLTPEILEKNFEIESNIFGLQTFKLNENFKLENRGDRFCLVRKCRYYYPSTFWICDLVYLHQLQHVLRFCGISIKIKL